MNASEFILRVERDNAEDFASEIADDLRLLRKKYDTYGLALMMIREGCAEPTRVAADALEKARSIFPGTETNASLINAAPDLLAALKAMVLNDSHTYRDCHKAALRAIAKAEQD